MNILVLVSGNGSNLQALIDAAKAGKLGPGSIVAVLSDRAGVYALERAKLAGIPVFTEVPNHNLAKDERRLELSNRILKICKACAIDLVIYAGFLSILKGDIIEAYAGRMINLHPALLPKFGGLGMYGERVHQAVIAAGEKESGCTVHLVDAGTDTGPILLQRKVPVLPGDTADSLAERIHHEEHIAIVEAAALMVKRFENKSWGII
ncbi:phosphoribosylglycinamide formyltransferase [Leadbettera azotonutricia]|uniref:Phosphoribosylglycinamide formyltransferase n=1 Tax=Leadbettera azotonutricia (strain ATCC BAA-888 / DSM 13862 / ZAS-9) TaxID=545695 RepID=F5YF25_LEAAZ|nr:phosphoribosylglycinamide formyltransferase [Leadbettera azotonutricia]AEF81325.1 phosphoribosylglycinamide formyltransferase [Leadbettera azotonutricia ZAS-9]